MLRRQQSSTNAACKQKITFNIWPPTLEEHKFIVDARSGCDECSSRLGPMMPSRGGEALELRSIRKNRGFFEAKVPYSIESGIAFRSFIISRSA